MRAHLFSIGSELLHGRLTDTNATFLAQELLANGIELIQVSQIGDDRHRLAATLRAALTEADLVVCSGGIGPTDDDVTREAIADVVGQAPVVDPDLLDDLRAFFRGRGLTMPERNAKQAWRIPAADILPNPVGTAPGWFVRTDAAIVVAMPGVPREMYRMWREQVVPRLAARMTERCYRSTTLRLIGIGESAAEDLLRELVTSVNPTVATYAKDDGIHVRITAYAATADEAERLRDAAAGEALNRLRRFVYASDETTLAQTLASLLRDRGLSLSVAEQGTGARFAALLAADPTVGDVLRGAELVLPSNGLETQDAAALAAQALERSRATVGLGVLVDVEPRDLDLYEGTVSVALVGAMTVSDQAATRAAYEEVQRRAALYAAEVLRRTLIDVS